MTTGIEILMGDAVQVSGFDGRYTVTGFRIDDGGRRLRVRCELPGGMSPSYFFPEQIARIARSGTNGARPSVLLPKEDREAIEWAKRLMPEGMEWPRFEDGEPVRVGYEAVLFGRPQKVEFIQFSDTCLFLESGDNDQQFSYGERVKRPDSWERLKADIYREVETDKGMRLASRFAEAIVLRCRALAERGER